MSQLKETLSKLTMKRAAALLGPNGKDLIRAGGRYPIDLDLDVTLTEDLFLLNIDKSLVTIRTSERAASGLELRCSTCNQPCDHAGAALAVILEEKLALHLAAPPPPSSPAGELTPEELTAQALADREERAATERMELKSMDLKTLWTDYTVTSLVSGKTYRVALRGWERGESYCNCPDFRKNTLGTCKHLLFALDRVKGRFSKTVRETPYRPSHSYVFLLYGRELELRLAVAEGLEGPPAGLLRPIAGKPITDPRDLLQRLSRAEQLGHEVTVYPDAEEYLQRALLMERLQKTAAEVRRDPASHPLRTTLLKTELLPYQLDGIGFALGAGRAILADDMGLGKTIQGIGTAELLARETGISRTLVVCPASLKSQWQAEIERHCDRSSQVIFGDGDFRAGQYQHRDSFFTICNYEQVLRDIDTIARETWDLIILDEGQRIKNWEAKTSRTIKGLRSPFALVLSGTPLENRLDELYSVVEFIDERRLGPAFRFFHTHRIEDEKGKVLGYRHLDEVRRQLQPILLRRTRKQVMQELPPRTTEIRRITPTEEQLQIHAAQQKTISTILKKRFLTEMDLLRLQKALLICRMAANSTYLVDKEPPGYSSKLEELEALLDQLTAEDDRKIVLFSEWTNMLNLIEPMLEKRRLPFVRLDGSVPQNRRQGLVRQFQQDPACKLFITTNAGSTGLNLQAANTIVNVELPWNPAILEQRIARAHRMGQQRPVQVYLLVTEATLEENLLATLAGKQELALAVLDPDSDVTAVNLASGIEELKRRLEQLFDTRPFAPVDESQRQKTEAEAAALVRKEKLATAGGQLLNAAFSFLGEVFATQEPSASDRELAEALRSKLATCMDRDEQGRLQMTVTLPDEKAVEHLALSLARILGGDRPGTLSHQS